MSGVPEIRSSTSCSLNYRKTVISREFTSSFQRYAYYRDEFLRYDLVESGKETFDLLLNRRVQAILRRKLYVFFPIFQRHWDRSTVLFQRNDLVLSKLR